MKKVLLILAVVAVLFVAMITAIVYGVMSITSVLPETVDSFFAEVKRGDMTKAREHLSTEFRNSTDEAALREFLTDSGLTRYKEGSWSTRSIKNGRGRLEGEVTTDDGATIPVEIHFVEEQDRWKIYSMRKSGAGAGDEPEAAEDSEGDVDTFVPDEAEVQALAKQSMHDFAISLNDKSMQHFAGTTAQLWQEQMTVEQLDEAFKSVIDANVDLTVLDPMTPVITTRTRDEDGALLVEGRFDSSPSKTHFKLRYMLEDSDWKLIEFNIDIK